MMRPHAPYYHAKGEDQSCADMRVRFAQTFVYRERRWQLVAAHLNLRWGDLEDDVERIAARVRAPVKLVVRNPLSSQGEVQIFDVLPAHCLN